MLRMGFPRSLRFLRMTMEGEANCHSEARRSCAVGISWVSDYVKWDSSSRRGLRMTVVGILAVAALPQNDNGGEADCHSEARRCRAVGILWVSGLCKVEFFAPKGAQNDSGWDSRGRCAPSE